jgi:hypothetical protein
MASFDRKLWLGSPNAGVNRGRSRASPPPDVLAAATGGIELCSRVWGSSCNISSDLVLTVEWERLAKATNDHREEKKEDSNSVH